MLFIIVVFLLSLLIFGHEAGHFFVAKFLGMRVDEFGFGFPPRMFSFKKGETTYSFNWLPFGGFVRIAGEHDIPSNSEEALQIQTLSPQEQSRFFSRQSALRRTAVILAGVTMNFFIGFLLLIPMYMIGTSSGKLIVAQVQKDSPAALVGIQTSDVIAGFESNAQFIEFVNANRGKEITLRVERRGASFDVSVTPRSVTKEGEGALGVVPVYAPRTEAESLGRAIIHSARSTYILTVSTVYGLGQFAVQLFGHGTIPEGIAGPVGIVSFAEKTAAVGFIFLLNLMSLISINLAVMNLLPLPALDGGRFFLIIIEKIKGSPVSHTIEAWINGLGFLLLIGLMILVTIKDIANF